MIASDFDARKAAQVVAFFARAEGGRINVLKLIKLVYLADRAFALRHGEPMFDDRWVSMDHGPVNSGVLDMVNGLGGPNGDWDSFIGLRAGYDVALSRPLTDEDFDELSRADWDVLRLTWTEFGHLDKFAVRDYTHRSCPEWENPHGASNPIPYERLYRHEGNEHAGELAEHIDAVRMLNRTFKEVSDVARKRV